MLALGWSEAELGRRGDSLVREQTPTTEIF
jgi:hypothetical protein